jgi:hypothetical protein
VTSRSRRRSLSRAAAPAALPDLARLLYLPDI